MLEELTKQPATEWSSILAVSRKPQQVTLGDPRLKFLAIDILAKSVEEITDVLKKAGGEDVTHVFHYTYLEGKDAKDQVELNHVLLQKSLDAIVSIAKHLEVFLLQTGLKVRYLLSNLNINLFY